MDLNILTPLLTPRSTINIYQSFAAESPIHPFSFVHWLSGCQSELKNARNIGIWAFFFYLFSKFWGNHLYYEAVQKCRYKWRFFTTMLKWYHRCFFHKVSNKKNGQEWSWVEPILKLQPCNPAETTAETQEIWTDGQIHHEIITLKPTWKIPMSPAPTPFF